MLVVVARSLVLFLSTRCGGQWVWMVIGLLRVGQCMTMLGSNEQSFTYDQQEDPFESRRNFQKRSRHSCKHPVGRHYTKAAS